MGTAETVLQPKVLQVNAHTAASQTIRYYTAGKSAGITFVFIPTIGTSSRLFEPLIERLATNFRILVVDLPGFGKSSPPFGSLDIRQYAEIVRQVIVHEEIIRPIMVGHGMGSQIVASLIARHTDISAKAILIAPTVAPKQRNMTAHYLKLCQDLLHEPPRTAFRVWREYCTTSPLQYIKALPAMLRNRIDGNLAGCQAAVMIIRGANDTIVPHAWAGKLAAIATVAGLFEIRGAPHFVHLTHTSEVADICEGFALAL